MGAPSRLARATGVKGGGLAGFARTLPRRARRRAAPEDREASERCSSRCARRSAQARDAARSVLMTEPFDIEKFKAALERAVPMPTPRRSSARMAALCRDGGVADARGASPVAQLVREAPTALRPRRSAPTSDRHRRRRSPMNEQHERSASRRAPCCFRGLRRWNARRRSRAAPRGRARSRRASPGSRRRPPAARCPASRAACAPGRWRASRRARAGAARSLETETASSTSSPRWWPRAMTRSPWAARATASDSMLTRIWRSVRGSPSTSRPAGRAGDERDGAGGGLAADEGPGVVGQVLQIAGRGSLAAAGIGRERGQRQRVLGGFQKIGGAVADVLGVVLVALVAERAEQLEHHQLREADDGIERRAQVVVDAGHELGPGPVALRREAAALAWRVGLDRCPLGDRRSMAISEILKGGGTAGVAARAVASAARLRRG